jgi:hypothetical protein
MRPKYAVRPSASSSRLSKTASRLARGWWMVHSEVVPSSCDMRRSVSPTICALLASRPLVGSSSSSRRGLCTTSTPMERRRRSPPLMPPARSLPMRELAHLRSPTALITSSARASLSATGTLRSSRSSAVKTTVSRTVSVSRHTVVCATKPEARL